MKVYTVWKSLIKKNQTQTPQSHTQNSSSDKAPSFAGRLSKSEVGEIKTEAEEQVLLYCIYSMQDTFPTPSTTSPKN